LLSSEKGRSNLIMQTILPINYTIITWVEKLGLFFKNKNKTNPKCLHSKELKPSCSPQKYSYIIDKTKDKKFSLSLLPLILRVFWQSALMWKNLFQFHNWFANVHHKSQARRSHAHGILKELIYDPKKGENKPQRRFWLKLYYCFSVALND
jgi:hypothetical protein